MRKTLVILTILGVFHTLLHGQSGSINNTLGTGGIFNVSGGGYLLTLSQSDGNLNTYHGLALHATTDSTLGVIYKYSQTAAGLPTNLGRFIHDYQVTGTNGFNTFMGLYSGNFAMSGTGAQASGNTSVGYSSLTSVTTGYQNSAIGSFALNSNTSGNANCAYGYSALYANTTGTDNSAFGASTLTTNATGQDNSAFGFQSLSINSSGSYNSAFGSKALGVGTSGSNNCAFGYGALKDNAAGDNSAFGYYSLVSNTSGNGNSAFGFQTLTLNTAGSNNSAFGYAAGSGLTVGQNNTFLGNNAQPSNDTANNEIVLGNVGIQYLRCAVFSISSLSDARDKRDIKDLPLGLDFLMTIKPRRFNWDRRDWYENKKPDGSKMKEEPTAGFIAQELDEAQMNAGAPWLNLVLKSNPDRLEATAGNLLPIMVKAIQELKTENDALRNEIAGMRAAVTKQLKEEVKALLLDEIRNEDKTKKLSMN